MMMDLLFQEASSTRCQAEQLTEMGRFDRPPVLAASRTASRLEDATLASLFRSYRVELFTQPFDLFVARTSQVSFALLCASAGYSTLAAEAYIIRKQWPLAKIIVLGLAPPELEDHLYDDTVVTNCHIGILAIAFSNHPVDLWNRRLGWKACRPELPQAPEESDPTKAGPFDLLQPPRGGRRDLPAGERQDLARALVLRHSVSSHA